MAAPASRLLDVTRLLSRVGQGPMTGIDRVEFAYLDRLLTEPAGCFALVRTGLGYILLNGDGARGFFDRLAGLVPWGKPDIWGRLRRLPDMQARAEADLRRLAFGRCRHGGLAALIARLLPANPIYLNVGHSLASARTLMALGRTQKVVMLHDTIPLDHPEFVRDGYGERFSSLLSAVSSHADRVICTTQSAAVSVSAALTGLGRCPSVTVAPLGVSLMPPADAQLPDGHDPQRPYFVSIGTLEARKNHALLLDVWEDMAAHRPEGGLPVLYIIGRRGWRNEDLFRRLTASPLYGTVIRELNAMDDAGANALLRGARGALYPSLAEGFGLPAAEAALAGTPVICSDLPAFREILGDYPVYLPTDDRYRWRKSVQELCERERDAWPAGGRLRTPPSLPDWDGHFNVVLSTI
ncbi:MAG: glycosyltransferase family 1 protein [Paracoccaceae bacterium]